MSGLRKAFCPSLVATVDLVSVNLPRLEKKIEEFKSLLENKEPRVEEVKQEKQKGKDIVFKLNFSNDYVGISTFINKAKVSFEIESTTAVVNNVSEIRTKSNELITTVVPLLASFPYRLHVFQFLKRVYLLVYQT